MPSRVRSVVSNVIADIVLLLILYLLFSLMGYAVSLTGLLLVVVAVVAAGVRSIVKGTDHSVFALVASLIEGFGPTLPIHHKHRPNLVHGGDHRVPVTNTLLHSRIVNCGLPTLHHD
jgi:hypothetical protein